VSLQWDGDSPPTADERWADDALYTEPQMRYPGEHRAPAPAPISARTWRRWALCALVFYVVLMLIIGALWGLLP
jgi:hypothetical protein